MNLESLLKEIYAEAGRAFPDARFVVLEDLPFYQKMRIELKKEFFIEVRINTRNKRISYALVENGVRIAGFDNLDRWHLHPFGNPEAHRKAPAPRPRRVFAYFKTGIERL